MIMLKNEKIDIPILEISEEVQNEQIERLKKVKSDRDETIVENKLKLITSACKFENENLLPLIINAAKSYATLGEIVEAMKVEFGEWTENSVF